MNINKILGIICIYDEKSIVIEGNNGDELLVSLLLELQDKSYAYFRIDTDNQRIELIYPSENTEEIRYSYRVEKLDE